ncbi:MAG: glycosyltransferase, partial [Salinispira sp.]
MKILFCANSLTLGGAERVTVTLANYWAQRGHNVIIFTLAPVAKDFYPYHSSIERMSFNESGKKYNALFTIVKNIFRVFRIRGVLRSSNPDIAMGIGDICSTILGLVSISMRNIVTIGTEHTHPPRKRHFEKKNRVRSLAYGMHSWAYGKLSAVVALTEKTAQWLQTNTSAKKVVVIPNAIEWPMPVKK